MSEELDVLKEVVGRLERAGIAYMITGSMAANFYTIPRMTRDIDIVVELGERDVARFIRCSKPTTISRRKRLSKRFEPKECLT